MPNPFAKKPSTESVVKKAVHDAIASNAMADESLDMKLEPDILTAEEMERTNHRKLSQLIDDDFPFDESQLRAINGLAAQRYGCLTGAAGTGKTTTTKKLVDTIQHQAGVNYVDMTGYFKKGYDSEDPADDYEVPQDFIPAIALVGFTGRSSQMIKKNFPRDWHGNIMTIHRLLAFAPEYYEDEDENGDLKTKMRFVPTYTAALKLPWDVVIVDEAGMVGLDLWHQLWAAMKPGARVYMIGDINQLPPVHGRSIFGFALAKWPSFELTHIHRQKGAHNAIVDNAWRVLRGEMPVSGGNFQMLELKGDANQASRQVRALAPKLREKGIYDPIRDTIITPINGNEGSRGFALGQLPLNAEFALIFNPQSESTRYIIDAGRERKQFAVGDKVMATKNDHEAGITNGMTGIITAIEAHEGYAGDHNRFGPVEAVNAWMASENEGLDDGEEFTLDDLSDSFEAVDKGKQEAKEKRDRGPASHKVTVQFGDDEHGFELVFATLSEVGSLMTAYVATCHKMQGGECPTIVIICHDAHKQMLYREWLYTALTRASARCILLYTPTALRTALNKQNIKGSTLKAKIESFNLLTKNNGLGAALKVECPDPERVDGRDDIWADADNDPDSDSGLTSDSDLPVNASGLGALIAKAKSQEVASVESQSKEPAPAVTELKEQPIKSPLFRKPFVVVVENVREIHHHHFHESTVPETETVRVVEPEPQALVEVDHYDSDRLDLLSARALSEATELEYLRQIEDSKPKLLTYQPAEAPKPKNPWAAKLKKG